MAKLFKANIAQSPTNLFKKFYNAIYEYNLLISTSNNFTNFLQFENQFLKQNKIVLTECCTHKHILFFL